MESLSSYARPHSQQSDLHRARWPRVFEVDAGYVVVCGTIEGLAIAQRFSKESRGRRLTLAIPASDRAAGANLESLAAKAADVCTRVVIYEPATGGRAALLARTVRSSARTECAVVLDSTRALRHCIDGMAPGDIIVYCCDVPDNALEILDDYGARSVEQIRPQPESEPCAGIASNAPAKAVARRPGVLGGF